MQFCALTFHQGRIVQVRSHESLIEEAKEITKDKDFKGYIHDVGGPTANFRHPSCKSRWSMAFVKRVSVCSRLRVRIWTQITEIMSVC